MRDTIGHEGTPSRLQQHPPRLLNGQQDQLRPRYISINAAARYAAVSRSQFYNFFMQRVRTLKLGKSRLVELDSLDAALDELAGVE
jgi:hypothetical protein